MLICFQQVTTETCTGGEQNAFELLVTLYTESTDVRLHLFGIHVSRRRNDVQKNFPKDILKVLLFTYCCLPSKLHAQKQQQQKNKPKG